MDGDAPAVELNVGSLRESFQALGPRMDRFTTTFYETLFLRYPGLRPLFTDASLEEQKRKLVRALALIIMNLRNPYRLHAYLGGLGQVHVAFEVEPAHYPPFGECLLVALEETLGEAWNGELSKAWTDAFETVTAIMLAGSHRPPRTARSRQTKDQTEQATGGS